MNAPVTGIDYSKEVDTLLRNAYAMRGSDLKHSIVLARQALDLSRNSNNERLIAQSLSKLSLFFMIRGQYRRSVSAAKEAIKYFENLNDEKGIADAQYSIAGVYYKTSNYHLGLINLIDCLAIYRKFNDFHNQARVYKSLGTIYEYFGDYRNAVRSYESSIDAAKKVKDNDLVGNALNPLSGIYLKQGKIARATRVINKAISIKTTTGDVRGLAFSLYGRGKVNIALHKYTEAEYDLNRAIEIHEEAGERLGLGMAYCKLGLIYKDTGQIEKAKAVLQKALDFSSQYKIIFTKFKSSFLLYRIYKQENNTPKALEYLEHYLTHKEMVINAQTLKIIESYELITKMDSLEKEAQLAREKAEIIKKQEHAEQAAVIKQNFLSTMSHEIRTPLNAVITITSLLSERGDHEEKQLLDSLKFAANNLLLIINDILDFTKLDAGKVHLEQLPYDLKLLLKSITETYSSMAREKGLETILNIDTNLALAYELDITKLSQILGNLISNAIKYTDAGKVIISVEKVGGEAKYDELRFSITDTGIGIPEDFFQEMFSSFAQPKSITTRKQGGSGLGLAIVKKLVELHGSTIHFESNVGAGTTFNFTLRLKRASIVKQYTESDVKLLNNKTALLADDNAINAMVARKLLSKWGISAEHAVNGLDAIEKAREKAFDFILMDIHMPEMNGFDATIHIRNTKNPNNNTPIFALTADITAENQDEYNTYFNGFLRKPIEIDKLYDALVNAK